MTIHKKFIYILIILAAVALLLRLGVSYELAGFNHGFNSVMRPSQATDMCTYRDLAAKIATGKWEGEFYYQPFYYAVFLPAIRILFGDSIWAVITVQALLGAITVYLTGLCSAMLWNRVAGIMAALLVTFSEALLLYTPYHLLGTLQTFWLILLLYLAIKALKSRKLIYWMLTGLCAGCGILTRGNIWFIVPGLLLVAIISLNNATSSNRENKKKRLKFIAALILFSVMLLLPQLPFAWHNSKLKGSLTGPSTASASVLTLGNTPESPPGGRNPELPAGPMEYPPSYYSWLNTADRVSIPVRIWQWVSSEPLAFIELTFRKLLLFWDYREIPNNVAFSSGREQSNLLRICGLSTTGLIAAAALAGMFMLISRTFKKRDLKLFLLYYFIFAYWLATAAFYILARFRAPVIPLLAIFSAIFLNRFWRLRKCDSRRAYLTGFPALLAGVFICFSAYDTYRENLEPAVMRQVRPNGIKVELSDGRTMRMDNGPLTFGGWNPVELKPEIFILKEFVLKSAGTTNKTEFELTLLFTESGTATISINGENKLFTAKEPGLVSETFTISQPTEKYVEIKLITADTPVYFFIDTQRNYSRTTLNDNPAGGELVCRLFSASNVSEKK